MRIPTAVALIPLVTLASACKKRPPDAPTELSELAAFLFERMWDDADESEELAAGIDNLTLWLDDHADEAMEGYIVNDLDEETIESVTPDREPGLGEVGGAAVVGEIQYGVTPVTRVLVVDEQEEVFDKYKEHDREFHGSPSKFMARNVDRLSTDNDVVTKLLLGITLDTHSKAQFRWFELPDDEGDVMLHRAWLTEPAENSVVTVQDQLYFGITLPWAGGSLRLSTTWANAEVIGNIVSEEGALETLVKEMSKETEDLEKYLDG